MKRNMRICPKCGRKTRTKGNVCLDPKCGAILTPDPIDPTPAPATAGAKKNGGNKKMKDKKTGNGILKILGYILGIAILLALAAIIIWAGILFIMDHIRGNDTALDAAAATDVITDTTAAETSAFAEDFSLNDPANPADVNSNIWDEVYNAGVMVGENGDVYYTQSGKNGSVLLHGKVEAGQTVVIDAYRLEKDDKIYSEGCILVLNGPVDFDKYPIFYTNGAAQIIATENTQKFLDENVWLKFSRGDRLADDSAWSYKTWALSNIWLPDGITLKELGLTAETDTYPSK